VTGYRIHTKADLCRLFGLATRPPISPLAELSLADLISLPFSSLQERADTHLVRLCPSRRFDAKRAFQDFAHGHVRQRICALDFLLTPVIVISLAVIDSRSLVHKPAIDSLVPRVRLIATILFSLGVVNQL
jgi:hypothetical protein